MRRSTRTLALTLATSAVLATGLALAPQAQGAPVPPARPAEEHCVVRVTGRDSAGQLQAGDPVCAPTQADALARSRQGVQAAAADWPIGIHYEGASYTGATLTVVGADCTGGWLNMPAGWSNRISSTKHGCPRIRHFDGYYLIGPEQTTLSPGSNLLSLNNRTSSIQYLP